MTHTINSDQHPPVTVICTCYNHAQFVETCLLTVVNQTYPNIQLIVIDNASTDDSVQVIEGVVAQRPQIVFLRNTQNLGLCKAFNQGLEIATGKYVIDLAADDTMLPTRVAKQVEAFEKLSEHYAVVFSNAEYIDEVGKVLGYHYALNGQRRAKNPVPSGDIYKEVLKHYFICTPTMMMRRSALMRLGGYDESLSYEDFDFFVRSAHDYKYHYLDEILTQKRVLDESLSTQFYQLGNAMLRSSWQVCNKAYELNRSQEEFDLLAQRIRSFIRKCFVAEDAEQAVAFVKLLNHIEDPGIKTRFLVWLCQLHLPVNWLYRKYADWRSHRNMILMRQGVPFVQLEG